MGEAITVGHVLAFVGVVGGVLAIGGLLLFVIWLINPFRSGH